MGEEDAIGLFQEASPGLIGLAYRILGSYADAEDVVQDTFMKWLDAEKDEIANPRAWLTTVCTRRCLDVLKNAHKSRVDYVGPWLPEPIQTDIERSPEDVMELASSLSMAFLLLLERLTPKERAAYLLYEIFEYSYEEVAQVLDVSEAACRKLVSRARGHVGEDQTRFQTPKAVQEDFLGAFQLALSEGRADVLEELLAKDVVFYSDGGGKVVAARRPVPGRESVINFLNRAIFPAWRPLEVTMREINGLQSMVLRYQEQTVAVVVFSYDDSGCVDNIYVMRNPEKLRIFTGKNMGNTLKLL